MQIIHTFTNEEWEGISHGTSYKPLEQFPLLLNSKPKEGDLVFVASHFGLYLGTAHFTACEIKTNYQVKKADVFHECITCKGHICLDDQIGVCVTYNKVELIFSVDPSRQEEVAALML